MQGDSTTATVTVTRSGGFTGAVALSVEGAPGSVSSRFDVPSASLPSTSSSTTVTLTVARAVAPGTYPITVRAQATGSAAQTANLSLVVAQRIAQLSLRRMSPNDQLSTNRGGLPITLTLILSQDGTTEATLTTRPGLPVGVTAALSTTTLREGSTQLTLTVDSTAVPGSYVAAIEATALNASPTTLNIPFTIQDEARLVVAFGPSPFTVARNSSGDAQLSVTALNYDQLFTINTLGLPSDVTLGFDRIVKSNGVSSYIARFTVGPSAPLGVFPVTVTATAPGVVSGADSLMLTVAAAPVGGATVFRFCGEAAERPIWFGIGRNGQSWSRIVPGAAGEYAFDFSLKTDVAWVIQQGADDFAITMLSGTEAEMAEFASWPCRGMGNVTLAGTVSNLGASDSVQVAVGPRSTVAPITVMTSGFSLFGRDDQPQDLLAVRRRPATVGAAATLDRVLIRRGVMAPVAGMLDALDFSGGDAVTPTSFTLSVTGVTADETPNTFAEFETVGGTRINVNLGVPEAGPQGDASSMAAAVPVSAQLPGDAHLLIASALRTSAGETVERRVLRRERTPSTSPLVLGPPPGAPFVYLQSSNPLRARFESSILEQSEYERLFSTVWQQASGTMRRTMQLHKTEALTSTSGNPTTRRLRAPLFDGAPGWNSEWELRPATRTTWAVEVFGWDAIGGTSAPRASGVVTRSYRWTGVVP